MKHVIIIGANGRSAREIIPQLQEQKDVKLRNKDFLRKKKVSSIIVGKEQIDYDTMLDKFYNLFYIERMMVGGRRCHELVIYPNWIGR